MDRPAAGGFLGLTAPSGLRVVVAPFGRNFERPLRGLKPLQPGFARWQTIQPRLSVSRLKGRPFYGQAMGQLRLTCTFSAECAQRVEMQSSRDYSSLSHHRTYRSVYGGSILWAGIYSCLPFLPLPENHTQHSFSYLRQFRYFPTGSQSFDCILLQRMNVPFTVYFDRNRSVLPAFAVL